MSLPIIGFFRERNNTEIFKFKAPHYQQAYHEIIDQLNEKGVYVAILMGQATYAAGAHFTRHWVQINEDGQYRFEERGPITVDAIYIKDYFDSDGTPLELNTIAFRKLCTNKHSAYNLLEKFHPKSYIAHSEEELRSAIHQLPGDMAAIKTLEGNSGTGVFVGKKEEALQLSHDEFPLQVQEFIETGAGVSGITTKRHDVRVVLANGEPILSTLRTPPEGGLKSNLGYGGESRLIPLQELPRDLLELCNEIDTLLAPYGQYRLYSADFGLTPDGWRLFEVNAMPGSINKARGEEALYYQDKLTDLLKEVALAGQRRQDDETDSRTR